MTAAIALTPPLPGHGELQTQIKNCDHQLTAILIVKFYWCQYGCAASLAKTLSIAGNLRCRFRWHYRAAASGVEK
ncbi:hypothetical protein, partial [Shinella sp. DD12]|uniref:hypothetical protein n=1 Tax=Shinella sp. DD12 TaxID=1410620 RepID=UPI001AEBF7B1